MWIEWLSICLNIGVFFECILVLLHYAPAAIQRRRGPMKPYDWLIVGIVIGFLGSLVNNVYWSMAWTIRFFGGSLEWWVENGSAANVAFRQIPLIIAGACHIYAARMANRSLGWKLITCAFGVALVIWAFVFVVAAK